MYIKRHSLQGCSVYWLEIKVWVKVPSVPCLSCHRKQTSQSVASDRGEVHVAACVSCLFPSIQPDRFSSLKHCNLLNNYTVMSWSQTLKNNFTEDIHVWTFLSFSLVNILKEQNCIPVRCVPPACWLSARRGVYMPGGVPAGVDLPHPLPVDRQTPVKT